ncbi:MAG TPA: VOC family protein [Ktedonobacteraceae bacterium]|jgi:catechol 2,3-dioxygenase-like lactoylglutathione lyase family enzyme|nr:VOC family protein [Ktedonobacteraceae bacterium]
MDYTFFMPAIEQEAVVSNQQIQKVKVKRLAHVGLWTTDVAAQVRFYHQVLGLDLHTTAALQAERDLELDEANVFLDLRSGEQCLGFFNETRPTASNGRKPVPRSQVHHLSLAVDSDAELAALAARLKMAGHELTLQPRANDPEQGDTLWLNDPDGNLLEIGVAVDDMFAHSTSRGYSARLSPVALQHVALYTGRLEEMVEFYTDALGFDISDWLLRESAWLRCNSNHHSLMLTQGTSGIDHVGFAATNGPELLHWADQLSMHQAPLLWGPGRHGAGNDLFLRFADPDGVHIELSAELQQYFDRDVTIPPRLWHTRATALNLWGGLPSWAREEAHV